MSQFVIARNQLLSAQLLSASEPVAAKINDRLYFGEWDYLLITAELGYMRMIA